MTDWMDRADCRSIDPELFFPSVGQHPKAARSVCGQCEVQTECLAFALALPGDLDSFGIFGGTTARQRGRLRRAMTNA